jgi:hypothetical protein
MGMAGRVAVHFSSDASRTGPCFYIRGFILVNVEICDNDDSKVVINAAQPLGATEYDSDELVVRPSCIQTSSHLWSAISWFYLCTY